MTYHPHLLVQVWNSFVSMIDSPAIVWFCYAWIFDLATGTLKGLSHNVNVKLDSSIGLKGLFRHVAILMIVVSVYPFLDVINFNGVGIMLVVFYASQYSISIIENLGQMGIKFPHWVTTKLEKLKSDSDEGTEK